MVVKLPFLLATLSRADVGIGLFGERRRRDEALKAVKRPNVRKALIGLRYSVVEEVWQSRSCEIEMPDGLGKMGVSKDKINWNNEQVRVTKLVRSLPLFSKSKKRPSVKT